MRLILNEVDNKFLIFDCKEYALPFPTSKEITSILDYTKFDNHFNNQQFQVNHLKKGDYKLIIDNILIGSFSSKQLSHGLNLSTFKNTPQYQQAQQVKQLCDKIQKGSFQTQSYSIHRNQIFKGFQRGSFTK